MKLYIKDKEEIMSISIKVKCDKCNIESTYPAHWIVKKSFIKYFENRGWDFKIKRFMTYCPDCTKKFNSNKEK